MKRDPPDRTSQLSGPGTSEGLPLWQAQKAAGSLWRCALQLVLYLMLAVAVNLASSGDSLRAS